MERLVLALSDRGYPSSAVSFLADPPAKPNGKDAAAAGAGRGEKSPLPPVNKKVVEKFQTFQRQCPISVHRPGWWYHRRGMATHCGVVIFSLDRGYSLNKTPN